MQILTVSQVSTYIKSLIEDSPHLKSVFICGELSNYKVGPNYHAYFTIKDEKSQLKCIMYSSYNSRLKFRPENGMKVICRGKIDVYMPSGVYQLNCLDMRPEGVGALQIAFEQMKEMLAKEGLFDEEHKKSIPKYPRKIGVATSNTGAAVEDIKNVLSRRYPLAEIVIAPTVVQGESAPSDIALSLEILDNIDDVDVIIVGRGGGSIEDLWAFNTEIVARAVYNCKTPVISAVGHETDFTICDFVSDMRAPTPSAAAELAVPDINNLKYKINALNEQALFLANNKVESLKQRINSYITSPAITKREAVINSSINNISSLNRQAFDIIAHRIDICEKNLGKLIYGVNALNPLNTLARGYSLTFKDDKLIKSVDDVKINDKITVKLNDGSINAIVIEGE